MTTFHDPATFVANAEEATNARDVDALVSVYAPDARVEIIIDGAAETHTGVNAIRRLWQTNLAVMDARDFRIVKTLQAAQNDTIVNSWQGTLAGGATAQGMECWRFDEAGTVIEHSLHGFFRVRAATSPVQRMLMLVSDPRTAVAFVRVATQLKFRTGKR